MTKDALDPQEMDVRSALRAALMAMVADAGRPADEILAQAEAEFSALLLGKDLSDSSMAQLARVIREVIAEAREELGQRSQS